MSNLIINLGNKYTEIFNSQPLQVRRQNIIRNMFSEINEMERTKVRMKAEYEKEVKYINDRIKEYERYIVETDREYEESRELLGIKGNNDKEK